MKKTLKYILFSGIVLLTFACQKVETTVDNNWAYPISGDWTVKVDDGTGATDPFLLTIYNSSYGKDSIWINDSSWPFQAKAAVNMTEKTFKTTEYNSYPTTPKNNDLVTISNAKLVGNDSIYFEAEFGSDAGTIYKYAGHRRLSYEEYNSK